MENTEKETEEWKDQCRRNLDRDTFHHIKYGFAKTFKPVMDEAPFRVFDTMQEYREWCDSHLPLYLGFKITKA
jgi:hypothetical protein